MAGTQRTSGERKGSSASRSPTKRLGDRTHSPAPSKPPNDADRPSAGLYIVATPIGNARDITLRALDILRHADVIACEDTRVTQKLLSIHGIKPNGLMSYHEHNAEKARPQIMKRLENGEIVAVVSDAGTPLINDPGFRLVTDCRAARLAVHAIPGASAVTTALVLAGLPTDRFMYCGFPPPKSGKRRTWLGGVQGVDATLVFLESPKRLAASLADMAAVLGAAREAAVLREMTKTFEETRTAPLGALATQYAEAPPPRGEVTIAVGPPGADEAPDREALVQRLKDALTTESVRAAAARISAETGMPRREIYNLALEIKKADETP